jgi:hypothetical protein
MKPLVLLLAVTLLSGLCLPLVAAPVEPTAITGIAMEGQSVVVTVRVPTGVRRVTLESRPKLGRGTWTPRDVKWTDGAAGELTFLLPASAAEAELLRVRDEAETELALPAGFFRGPTTFSPLTTVSETRALPGVSDFGGAGTLVTTAGLIAGTDLNLNGASRAVVESDIWKVEGRTVYFFNQQRGLQVIDVTDPDAPRVRGTLPLAVWGEQMYRLPADTGDGTVWLALLAQNGCDNNSEVLLVAVRDGQPSLQGRVALTGALRESRLVGDVLYTASFTWFQPPAEPSPNGAGMIWQPGEPRTTVAGLDLADPRQPGIRAAVELAASPNAISATDRWLLVATTGTRTPAPNERLAPWAIAGNQSVILFDISDPRGEVRQAGALLTAGRVDSKFKLGLNGDVLTVVSEAGNTGVVQPVIDPVTGKVTEQWVWQPPRAVLETFSLSQPNEPARLAELTLIQNQQVYGTRFEGNRVYVVTFLRVDPLWIVDLSDPAKPVVQGKLEVPGWSNYLHPLGDQLLAVGVEGGRAALSLFDVKDATKPGLLSKVLLGEGWSWTEANNDEKALAVLPEAGLLLVPWSGQKPAQVSGWFSGMQLVDYDRAAGSLRARGVIDHSFPARRATVLGDRVVSLAGDAVLTADIADRDRPLVRGELALTHQVDRVFVAGDRLVQLAYWPSNRVVLTHSSAPETAVATLPLLSLPVVGAEVRDGRLYLLQHQPENFRYEEVRVTNETVITREQPPKWVWFTNFTVTLQPQPPLTNLTQVWREIEMPPTPDSPGYLTNRLVWRLEITPQPDVPVTNAVVLMTSEPQPPLVQTNVVVNTEWRSIPIPAESAFSVIAWSGDRLELAGQDRQPLPASLGGFNLEALWTDARTVVWTEKANSWRGWFGGGLVPQVSSGLVVMDIANPLGIFPGSGWWWPGWGTGTRNLLAFDVGSPEPKRVAAERFTSAGGWSEFSAAFVADGKVFLSEQLTESVPNPKPPADPAIPAPNLWQNTYRLHVVDFADPAAPVVRPAAPLPAELVGVSHAGQMLYARRNGQPAWGGQVAKPTELLALAYDGLSASLVGQMPLAPDGGRPAVLVRANGQVLAGFPPATADGPASLEAWTVDAVGQFVRQGSLRTGSPVTAFVEFANVIVATTTGDFLFLSPAAPEALTLTGVGVRPCTLWTGPESGDATAAGGLWLPRGAFGLWHVPVQP